MLNSKKHLLFYFLNKFKKKVPDTLRQFNAILIKLSQRKKGKKSIRGTQFGLHKWKIGNVGIELLVLQSSKQLKRYVCKPVRGALVLIRIGFAAEFIGSKLEILNVNRVLAESYFPE